MKKSILLYCFIFLAPLVQSQNNALDLDGENDYCASPTTALFNTSNYTMECWVRIDNPSVGNNDFMLEIGEENIFPSKWLWFSNDYFGPEPKFVAGFYDSELGFLDCLFDYPINAGEWIHLAEVYDGTTMELYINGISQGTCTFGGTPSTGNHELYIGKQIWEGVPSHFLNGAIDEVRFWNTSRSAIEIQENMNIELNGNEPGLVAYYPMNQGVPCETNTRETIMVDKSSNNLDATLINFSLNGNCHSNWIESGVSIGIDTDGDGVPDDKDECSCVDDSIDTNEDGLPDCKYPPYTFYGSIPVIRIPEEFICDARKKTVLITYFPRYGNRNPIVICVPQFLVPFILKISPQTYLGDGSDCFDDSNMRIADDSNFNPIIIDNTNNLKAIRTVEELEKVIYSSSNQIIKNPNTNDSLLNVYPNPARNYVTVYVNQKGYLEIYNQVGQLVFEKQISEGDNEVDLSGLSSGIYFVKSNRGKVRRIVKQ